MTMQTNESNKAQGFEGWRRMIPIIGCFLVSLIFCPGVHAQNPYKAPLYWSVYEHHILKEQAGQSSNYIPETEWLANIDWVDENLRDLGYDMICIDGWGDVSQLDQNGYRKSHSSNWAHDYAWWSAHLQERGMTLGMYGNPLWVNVGQNDTRKIVGTDIPVASLVDYSEETLWFSWVQVDRPGAEEYVKGYFKFYADMGVQYFRVDFLSWFENGWDRYIGNVGPERPREHYETVLRWMREAADENGMFLSLVMPHLFEEATAEKEYGHMFRINEDTGEGGWWKWSEKDRGIKRNGWSVYANPFDGLTYWSYLAGPGKVILDPDFIRLNTFANDAEKKSVVSLCLMAGGALTVSDQYSTIGNDLWLYQNRELLELNWDGFVGKPLTNDPTKQESQIWTGQMSDGSWIVALFNRENGSRMRSIDFNSLGLSGNAQVRDLWLHENLESASSFSADIPSHGCRVIKVVAEGQILNGPNALFVESLVTGTQGEEEKNATAMVTVKDNQGNPVEGATVTVSFSVSFTERVTGITGADGTVSLVTSAAKSGELRIAACVSHVSHESLIYAADLNQAACESLSFFMGGTFNNWKLEPMKFKDGIWKRDSLNLAAGNYELKFANTNDWSGDDWGNASGLTGTAQLTTGGDPNISFTIENAGYYGVSFNDITLDYVITEVDLDKLNDEMFVGGTFTSWALQPMTFDGENWIIENVSIASGVQSLKFANTSDWSGDDWGNAAGMSGTARLSTGGDPNITFKAPEDAAYTITFNDISLQYSIAVPGVLGAGKRESMLLYPNPTSGFLNFRGMLLDQIDTRIYNTIGQEVEVPIYEGRMDLSQLRNGMYYLRVPSPEGLQIEKIIKISE